MLTVKIPEHSNGFFRLVDEVDGEIATCFLPSLIGKVIEIANAYNQAKGYDLITTKEAKIAQAEIRLCEANSEQKKAQQQFEELKKEKEQENAKL